LVKDVVPLLIHGEKRLEKGRRFMRLPRHSATQIRLTATSDSYPSLLHFDFAFRIVAAFDASPHDTLSADR
jgi:hypothetical protein